MIDREDLLFFYIEQNNSLEETAKHFNCGTTTIKRYLSKYNIHKSKELSLERQKQTCIDRYGKPFPAEVESIKSKIDATNLKRYGSKSPLSSKMVREKIKQSLFKNYGVNSPFESPTIKERAKQTTLKRFGVEYSLSNITVKERAKQTCIDKYGVSNVMKSPVVKEKLKNTFISKYGVDNPMQDPIIKEKVRQTCIDRYGVYNFTKLPSFKDLLRSKVFTLDDIVELSSRSSLEEFLNKFIEDLDRLPHIIEVAKALGVSYNSALLKIKEYNLLNLVDMKESYLEGQIEDFLKSLNIKYIKHSRALITPLEIDFYIPEYQLAIEVNDIVSHNATLGYLGACPKDKNYHFNKSSLCEEKGIRLIHIWEYEWNNERQRPILENIIKGALQLNSKIYARKCSIVIKSSKEMKEFFNTNNIQGFRPGKFAVCLEYNNEIVMAYLFGKAYFGKGKYELEVIRGATKLGINVVGGASKIWKYFIEHYNVNSCVYYVDYNYFNGSSLLNLPNMEYIKTQGSYKNYFIDSGEIKNRNPYKDKEIRELYKQGKVLQIYNAGVKVYVWERPKI